MVDLEVDWRGTYEDEPFGQNALELGKVAEELGHFGRFLDLG